MCSLSIATFSCKDDDEENDNCKLAGTWCLWLNNSCDSESDIVLSANGDYSEDGISNLFKWSASSDCKKLILKHKLTGIEAFSYTINSNSNGILILTDDRVGDQSEYRRK